MTDLAKYEIRLLETLEGTWHWTIDACTNTTRTPSAKGRVQYAKPEDALAVALNYKLSCLPVYAQVAP